MNKLIPTLLSLFTLVTVTANAQQKKVVAIMPFLTASPTYGEAASALHAVALEVFGHKPNITIVDRAADAMVLKELDMQIREQSIGSKVLVKQGKLSGSQEIIVGRLNAVSLEARSGKYIASLNYTLQVNDASTGIMISSKNFSGTTNAQDLGHKIFGNTNIIGQASYIMMADTKEEAVRKAISASNKQMEEWIDEVYPPNIKILSVDKRNGKGYPTILSMAGFETSVPVGKVIIVNEITIRDDGAGNKLRQVKKIAELKVSAAMGDVTECKVKDGEDVLDEKMKSGAQLQFTVKF